jgi:branched-chain amino acid transport system substrate-binding protein
MIMSRTTRRRTLKVAAMLVAASTVLSACGRNSSNSAGDSSSAAPIVIAATYPQSGALAITGASGRGVKAAIDEANANGSINGRTMRWIGFDDAYDPARMATNARAAIQQDHADVLISFGGPSLAIRPFVNQNKVFNLVLAGNTAFSDNSTFPYTHAAFPDLEWEAAIEAAALNKTTPDAKVGVLGFDNDLTTSQVAGVSAGGYKPSLVLRVAPSQQDVTAQVTQLKNAGVTTVFMSFGIGQVIGAVKYMTAINYKPTIVVYSAQAGKSDAITALGAAAKGIYTAFWDADPADALFSKTDDIAEFKKAIANSGTPSDANNVLAMSGYITGRELIATLKAAKGVTGDDLNTAWKSLKNVSVPGLPPGTTLGYGAGGRQVHTYQLARWGGTAWQTQGAQVDAVTAGYAK